MIGIICQARTKSTRFPRKIYEDINGTYTLQRVLKGLTASQLPHKIILAMPKYDESEFMERLERGDFIGCIDNRFATYFGSSDDLVDRYFQAARKFGVDTVVRCTADCPLVQGSLIDEMLCEYLKNNYNGFCSNIYTVSDVPYPCGISAEIFPYWMLAETWQLTKDPYHREHVTPFMYRRGTQYNIHSFRNCKPNSIISTRFPDFSFDTPDDLSLIKAICENYDKHGNLDLAIKETGLIKHGSQNQTNI